MRIAQSLTAIVPGQPLGSRFLEYQRRMTTKLTGGTTLLELLLLCVDGNLKR